MEWTLALLFGVSILLLMISIIKSRQAANKNQREIDTVHVEVMKEINNMQDSIRNIELDMEIVTNAAGVQLTMDEIILRREVLDLYKRQYSLDSIAEKKQITETEVKEILTGYLTSSVEGGKVAHEA
ncbi:hypothetical protein [Neobacillus sp. LXY-1]|uniref:hypothetical protein n=1 Tax=Neobacillus sp. LXY-1 TaxID=3379133 RepID=UPI003EE33F66